MKEIKEDLNEWRDISYTWTGRLYILRMSVLPELIIHFPAIPIKIPVSHCGYRQPDSQVCMERQKNQNTQYTLNGKLKVRELTSLSLRHTLKQQ